MIHNKLITLRDKPIWVYPLNITINCNNLIVS